MTTDSDNRQTHGSFAVACFHGLQGIHELEHQWRELEALQGAPGFCQGFDWFQAAMSAGLFDADATQVFSVSFQGRCRLILPLCWRRRRVVGFLLRCWETPQHPHHPFSTLLLDAEHGGEALRYLFAWLQSHSPQPWDCLYIARRLVLDANSDCLSPGSVGLGLQSNLTRNTYVRCNAADARRSDRQLRRARQRLERQGEVALVEARDGIALETAFVQFLQLERDGWKGRRGSAIAQNIQLVGFYRRLIALGANRRGGVPQGELQPVIYLLRQTGRPIAAVFAVQQDGTCYLLKIAWAQRARAGSPGKVLIELIRERWCAADPERELNFVSAAGWVSGWSPASRPVVACRWFNRSARGMSAALLLRLVRPLRALVHSLRRRSAST